jgi:peptidoglycan-associated lipoprotein
MTKGNIKNTLISICAIALLAGCTSKQNVEYEDATQTQQGTTQDSYNVDDKAAGISGSEETSVQSINEEMSGSTLTVVTNDELNSIESEIEGVTVILESVHFGFDKYNLTDEMRAVASTNYNKISQTQEAYEGLKVKLEGNTDEWGTDEYNYALGLKRAKTAKDALIADGMNPDKIIMVSYGESNPICTQKNTTCWKMNRRVDYRLLP